MANDQGIFESLRAFLRPGMHAIDVGAHAGKFALEMARRVGPSGRVLAIEPDPTSASALRAHAGIRTIEAAAGAVAEPARTFWSGASDRRHGSLFQQAVECVGRSRVVTVPVVTIDDIVARELDGRVDAIKVDTQGGDYDVLRGAERAMASASDLWVCVEVWPVGMACAGWSVDDLRALMDRQGLVCEHPGWDTVIAVSEKHRVARSGYVDVVFRKRR